MAIIEIYGVTFLECEKQDCDWNIGYTPKDLNRHGLEFTFRSGVGTRVCNFGCKALAYGKHIDPNCPHREELCELLGQKDSTFQTRFWGTVDPDVAWRALNTNPE